MKYNRALDLLCAAAEFQKAGQPLRAAKALTAAVKDPSLTKAFALVEAANSAAHAKLTAANFDDAAADDEPGEDLRIVPEENGDRIVQESAASDDEDDDSLEAAAEDDEEEADEEVEKAEAALRAAKMRAARRNRASKTVEASVSPEKRLAQALRNS
jgi:hypothetical protein